MYHNKITNNIPFAAAAAAKSLQLCPTLCDPIDGSPPGSLVPGVLQARTLEWVATSFSKYPLYHSLNVCRVYTDVIEFVFLSFLRGQSSCGIFHFINTLKNQLSFVLVFFILPIFSYFLFHWILCFYYYFLPSTFFVLQKQ